jgi:predicted DNA-binding transcriptional regulator YafY
MLLSELSEVIDNAIINEEVVRFDYFANGYPQSRTLSPYEASEASEDGESILGFDHDRAALRRFQYSKIMDIETIEDEDYVKPIDQGGM